MKILIFLYLFISLSFTLAQSNLEKIKDNAYFQRHESKEQYIQRIGHYSFKDNFKKLTLENAIEMGLTQNHSNHLYALKQDLIKIDLKKAYKKFWYPEFKLTLSTNTHPLINIKGDRPYSPAPYGSFGLLLDDYTIFNWGKDYMAYLNQKSIYDRNVEELDESKLILKYDIMENFFYLMHLKNKLKYTKEYLRHASFIYRTNKQRVVLKKIKKQEYYQARALYLSAQQLYHDTKAEVTIQDEHMNFLLADVPNTRYIIEEEIKFNPLQTKVDEANQYAIRLSPLIKEAKSSLDQANRSYSIVQKENMPLPRFDIRLGAYQHYFGPGVSETTFQNSYGNDDINGIELVATINASWDLWGENGFLNKRKKARAHLSRTIAHRELLHATELSKSLIKQTFRKIYYYQDRIKILKPKVSNGEKLFNMIVDSYLKKGCSFEAYQSVLNNQLNSKISLHQTTYLHVKEKINLARYIGSNSLPGDSFNTMVEVPNKFEQKD